MLTVCFMVGLPFLTLYVSETIVRKALDMPFSVWTTEFTKRFALNIIILIAVFNVLYILPRKWFMFTSFLVSCILVIFAVANNMKIELRNSPISLGDFALLNELRGLENPVDLSMPLIIGGSVAFLSIAAAIFWFVSIVSACCVLNICSSFLSVSLLF